MIGAAVRAPRKRRSERPVAFRGATPCALVTASSGKPYCATMPKRPRGGETASRDRGQTACCSYGAWIVTVYAVRVPAIAVTAALLSSSLSGIASSASTSAKRL